jgi:hypothetical protein
MEGGEKGDAESVAFSTVAVSLGGDLETLERSDDVFVADAFLRHRCIEAFLRFGQLATLGFFDGQQGVGVFFWCTLIAGVIDGLGLRFQTPAGIFEQLVIVAFAFGGTDAENAPRGFFHDDWRLQRVAFLFAGVEALLFFGGRSQGVSVASTRLTSNCTSDFSNAFVPGRRNALLLIRTSSSQRIVFQQELSLTP